MSSIDGFQEVVGLSSPDFPQNEAIRNNDGKTDGIGPIKQTQGLRIKREGTWGSSHGQEANL